MPSKLLRARWYDGLSAVARPALVWLEQGTGAPALHWHPIGAAAAHQRPCDRIGWPERFSATRLPARITVDLREQGSLEIDDVAAWYELAASTPAGNTLAQRMQTRWRVLAAVALAAVVGLFAFYRWGTPWAATQLTAWVPLRWETELSQRAMADLDGSWLKPSKLPAARQAQLREAFQALTGRLAPALHRYGGYTPVLNLQFRSGLGANAFALPGGTIVMTDGLVEAAARKGLPDDALVGVLAHEIGHVIHRHTTRLVVEQGVLNIGLGLALGDVSTVVSTGGSLLTGLAYRRGHETEADCFAVTLMRAAGRPVPPMAELLLGLDAPAPAAEAGGPWSELLSSHPATPERARKLKAGAVEGCR